MATARGNLELPALAPPIRTRSRRPRRKSPGLGPESPRRGPATWPTPQIRIGRSPQVHMRKWLRSIHQLLPPWREMMPKRGQSSENPRLPPRSKSGEETPRPTDDSANPRGRRSHSAQRQARLAFGIGLSLFTHCAFLHSMHSVGEFRRLVQPFGYSGNTSALTSATTPTRSVSFDVALFMSSPRMGQSQISPSHRPGFPSHRPGYWVPRADSGGSDRDTLIICAGFLDLGISSVRKSENFFPVAAVAAVSAIAMTKSSQITRKRDASCAARIRG